MVAEKPITNASPQCATMRRVTALGVLECVIATGVAWWVVWANGVYVHLLIAVSLAAPLLLRSPNERTAQQELRSTSSGSDVEIKGDSGSPQRSRVGIATSSSRSPSPPRQRHRRVGGDSYSKHDGA